MISFFIFIFILSLLIIVHEFGHFIMAKRMGVRVEKFSLGFGPQLLKIKKGGTEYSISLIPLGGYVKPAGDNLEEYKGESYEYFSQSPGRRFQIIFFGPLLNYILGFLCFWVIFFAGYPALTTKVGSLIDGFGAKEAGLQLGDRIISIDGKKITFWEELQNIIYKKRAYDKVELSVLRGNKELKFDILIKEKEMEDAEGKKHSIGLIGITPYTLDAKGDFARSFTLGIKRAWELTIITYKGLWRILTGKLAVRESVTGPLGMLFITSKVVPLGLMAVLNYLGLISVSLALINLLPLPVLDGGHILFLGIEKIRGKTLSIKAERLITQAGVTVIVSLAILVTYIDIVRFFGDKIASFFK